MIPTLLSGGGAMRIQYLDAEADKKEFQRWQSRLQTLDPFMDVDDDGHLNEWLDPKEWDSVFAELERMPKESRSLRTAISLVDPQAL
jgi:hypothetical protein